jgi:hypothetical protein
MRSFAIEWTTWIAKPANASAANANPAINPSPGVAANTRAKLERPCIAKTPLVVGHLEN